MRNRYKYTFIFYCVLIDFVAIVSAACLFLRFSPQFSGSFNFLVLTNFVCASLICWIVPALFFRLYPLDVDFKLENFYRSSWRTFLVHVILWNSYVILFRAELQFEINTPSNIFLISFLLIYLTVSRIAITLIVKNIRSFIKKPFNIAIWGFNKTSIELASQLETNLYFSNFIGIINTQNENLFKSKKKFAEVFSKEIVRASEMDIHELYIVVQPKYIVDLNYFFELADNHCLRLKFVPDFSMMSKRKVSSTNYEGFHILKPRNEPLQKSSNRLVKRVFDLVFSSLVIVLLLSWLYPILAFLIKKQSKGPVLFKQMRTGKKNVPFLCFKFRSMNINEQSDSMQAKKDDDRVTSIGKFIRRTSLDELPQFFNVFLGEMSIVGPRPHMLKHTEDYNDLIRNFMVRHFVKPGITGLAQVSGYRGETKTVLDMKRRVKMDIDYVLNWSLLKDIKICFLTIIVTLKGDQNAF